MPSCGLRGYLMSSSDSAAGGVLSRGIREVLVGQWPVAGIRSLILSGLLAATATVNVRAQGTATISVLADQPGAQVSPNLWGIFFEEINNAGDGGIYGELVRNRSFEDATNALPYWTVVTNGSATGQIAQDTSLPMSATNLHSLKLTMSGGSGSIGAANAGYWGIPLVKGASYNLGLYGRAPNGFTGPITVWLESTNGTTVYAQGQILGFSTVWQHYSVTLVPNATDPYAQLVVSISSPSTVYLDFVSLFPAQTYNNRTNGLRPDLANMLANLNPSFVRLPGGSWVDGSSLADAYHWEPTIGDPANRVPRANLWGYVVDNGLGYHEYLQMCEDIGAQPLFAVNCGMDVGQNAVPPNQLGPWVQEALDAIAYANSDTNTPWGALRAANGHPAPFNLRMMEIGNENGGSAYDANYSMFYDAIKSNYPYMHLVANDQGSIPTSRPVEIQDEHYYSSPAFFIGNDTKYDSYSRSGPRVFVGEYAVTDGSGNGNLAGALGEAAFMTGMERNADIVAMASYAPLFANLNGKAWNPDLIYFVQNQVYGTPSYYVQQMFSHNRGDLILPVAASASVNGGNLNPQGATGVGSWNTSVQYSNIVVTSNGITLYQSDFVHAGTNGWRVYAGTWSTNNGVYQQTALITDCRSTTGNTNWANYTISLKAMKVTGSEGFLVMFNWLDDNDWTWFNVGGWGNTMDGVEQMVGGAKSLVGPQNADSITAGQWYDIRVVLNGQHVQCYLNSNLVQDVTYTISGGFASSSTYERSSGNIIVKAVNAYNSPLSTTINLSGVDSVASSASVVQLTSGNALDENSLATPTKVFPATNVINSAGTNFSTILPANSLSIFRFQASGLHAVTNLVLQVASPINMGQVTPAQVWGQESGGATVDLASNLVTARGVDFSSGDPTIAVVDSTGNVVGVAPGTTYIAAAYNGLTSTQAVQVVGVPIPPTRLIHRYSFDDGTASDSAGTNNGTFYNTSGLASISGGQLNLTGSSGDYVDLGPNVIASNVLASGAFSLEAWATFYPVNGAWARLFDFGAINGTVGGYDIYLTGNNVVNGGSARLAVSDATPGYTDETGLFVANFLGQTNLHVVTVFNPNPGRQFLGLYLNGTLATSVSTGNKSVASIDDVYSFLGRSLYSGDAWLAGSIDEFRIYDGELNANQVAATQVLGPNGLLSSAPAALTATVSNTNLTLSWPLASAGVKLQSSADIGAGNWATVPVPAQIVGSQWEVTVPMAPGTEFYRLKE